MRQATLGVVGRPDLGDLAHQYRNLPAEEVAELVAKGKAATAIAKGGAHTFGLETREQQRLARKRTFEQAVGVAQAVESGIALGVPLTRSSSSNFETGIVASSAPGMRQNSWAQLVALKQSLRQERAADIARSRVLQEQATKYQNDRGAEDLSVLDASLGGAPRLGREFDFESRPHPADVVEHQAFMWKPAGVMRRVQSALKLRRGTLAGNKFVRSVFGRLGHPLHHLSIPRGSTCRRATRRKEKEAGCADERVPHRRYVCLRRAWAHAAAAGRKHRRGD